MKMGSRMPTSHQFSRIDTLEMKSRMERKLGRSRATSYFSLLAKYLASKISKSEFDQLCIGTVGRESVPLHNHLIRSIMRNVYLSKTPPSKAGKLEGSLNIKVPNGYQRSSLQSLCRDFPQSPRKGRTPNLRDRKFRDRLSPLGPHGKTHNISVEESVPKYQGQQSATELLSLGSRPPGSVEDGEEVDQAAASPSAHSRSPVRPPLGIPLNNKGMRKVMCNGLTSAFCTQTCHSCGELPDTSSLRKRLEEKLMKEGLKISEDCANLLNNSIDVFLKRMIKPCLELTASRSGQKYIDQRSGPVMHGLNGMWPVRNVEKSSGSAPVSMLDLKVAMEFNHLILGEEWPMQLEKFCWRASSERN
ncbi:hypothetical protein HS088_TW01G00761 [Tripterygium wilfordii]|uniref:Transcriptional coactivator Hfi1/Transcriptional adapter 1 n=1 Tax=Tripterygium wilfordii TaxID=458696 RepID=A0A7J7E2T6_TRIWF|nr:uncharacterized protein LOC119998452 [Tripterygium wilfordii]KAF5752843.1 hypothetical protein HS088_TW01G00761 [Tripterygium wilfordii]